MKTAKGLPSGKPFFIVPFTLDPVPYTLVPIL